MKQKTGRKLMGFLLALVMTIGLMPGMNMETWAETAVPANGNDAGDGLKYVVGFSDASASGWSEDSQGHVISKLFDADGGTKICGPLANGGATIEFQAAQAFVPKKYYFRTADGAGQNLSKRNPKSWTISAKKNLSDNWTTIAVVNDDQTMGAVSYTAYEYSFDNTADKAYKYYQINILAIQNSDSSDNNNFELSEVYMAGFTYDLMIGSNEVTENNTSGDHWSYDIETNTLTLSNYTFNGTGTVRSNDDPAVIMNYSRSRTFNIVLEGNNTIKQGLQEGKSATWGIYSRSDCIIGGSGTLDISTADGEDRGAAIYAEKNLTIGNTCTINATSGTVTGNEQGYGIGGGESSVLTIGANARVTLTGPKGGTNIKVINEVSGTGWTDTAGTQGQTSIEISTSGQNLSIYKKIQFPAVISASVTTSEGTTEYGSLTDALDAWGYGSTLKLLRDVTTVSTINVSDTKVLDLNGYGITANTSSGSFSVITVGAAGNLTITDSRPTAGKHYYTITPPATNSAGAGLAAIVEQSSYNSAAENVRGTFKGGYITGGVAANGGGGGIYCQGNLTINGGTIIGNKSETTEGGGGVHLKSSGNTFTMTGGAIIGNTTTTGWGGGVYVHSGANFKMTGGTIEKNYAYKNPDGSGGGINVEGDGTFTLNGGTIRNNAANGKAGNINVAVNTFNLSGKPVIQDGIAGENTVSNVYLNSGKTITLTGPLTVGASIGVSSASDPSSSDVKIATGAVKDDIKYIHSDLPKNAGVIFCDGQETPTHYQYIDGDIMSTTDFIHTDHTSVGVYLTKITPKQVIYDGNNPTSGTAPSNQDCSIGGSVTVAGNTGSLDKSGNKFLGWSRNPSAKVAQYRPGDTITLTSDMLGGNNYVTLYAVWVPEDQIPLTIQNNGYPWGSSMSSIVFTLNTGVEEDITPTYQWESKPDGASAYTEINGASGPTYTVSGGNQPADGTWYRCKINNVYTEAVQVIKPKYSDDYWEVSDLYGRIWTSPYEDSNWDYSWYISNGTMAYSMDTSQKKFDVVGAYTRGSNTYMLQTAYGGNGWQMYSSAASHPGATDYYYASPASLDSVKFAFSGNNPNELVIEADLGDGQQSFSFGTDTQLGNYETSGSYADYAALEAQKNGDNTLKQVVMVGAAKTTESDAPAFVIRSKEKDNVPFYYLGRYYERQPFGYNANNTGDYWGPVVKSAIKATGLGTVEGMTQVLDNDTGMTMSWYDIPAGGSVKFDFSVGSAKDTGAVESAINYGMEALEGLEPGTDYTITCDDVVYTFTSTTEGTIALSGTDESDTPKTYNFIGKSISVQTGDKEAKVLTVAARPTGVIPVNVDNSIASKPIEVRESDYAVTRDSITLNFDVTDNSNAALQKRTQEYRIYYENGNQIESCGWVKPGADGKVKFIGLTAGTSYIVKARIPATDNAPCSDPVSNDYSVVKTAANITVNTPAISSGTTTVTLDGTDKEGAAVAYSKALDESYTDEAPTFTEGGKYTIYYRVVKENSQPLYGSYEVTKDCRVTLNAKGGTLGGSGNYNVAYGEKVNNGTLADPTNDSLKFAGWYADEACTKLWSVETNTVTSDMTLYARWVQSLSNFGFDDADIATFMTLQLFKGNVPVSEEKAIDNGQFSQFTNIPDGEYQMVITTNNETGNKVISLLVKVENIEGVVNVSGTATKPEKTINSKVKVEDGAPNVVVGQLDAEAAVKTEEKCVYWDAKYDVEKEDTSGNPIKTSVNLILQVKNEEDLSALNISEAEAQKGFSKEEQDLRNAQKELNTIARGQTLSFMDFSVVKEVTQTETVDSTTKTFSLGSENIEKTRKVLEIVVPFDTSLENICVYRSHNGSKETFTKLTQRPVDPDNYTDGTYYVGNHANGEDFVVIYAQKFSTYAIGYGAKTPQGGGTPVITTYPPVITQPEHGTIISSPVRPKAGDNVIITVTPEEGYETEEIIVIVKDKDGNPISVTKNDDGTYTFVQPASGSVTISAELSLKDDVVVRFDLNDMTGLVPDPQTFAKGGKATRPDDPTLEGYKFTGWFTDKKGQNAYDFDTAVNEDLILYAGWEKISEPEPDYEDFGIYFVELFDDPYEGVYYNETAKRYEIVYTGQPIRPAIMVTSKADGVLKEGIDYSVNYSNNKNASSAKPAVIKVTGKGTFKDTKTLELYILPVDLNEAVDKELLDIDEEIMVANGKKAAPVMVYRGYQLKSSDYDLNNKAAIKADTTIDITGKKNFTGTLKVPVKVMTADVIKANSIKVALKAGTHIYNGEEQELTITTEKQAGELTVTAGTSKTPLVQDTDFTVEYRSNVNAGTAAVMIKGIGDKTGTIVKTFKILPDKNVVINAQLEDPESPVYYNARGAMPDITVEAQVPVTITGADGESVDNLTADLVDPVATESVTLVQGRDYSVSYSNNKKVGNGTYIVKFIGNYKGHTQIKNTFKIDPASVDEARVEAAQLVYGKPGKYLSKPFVSVDGVQLKTSDYTFKYYEGEITDVDGAKELTAKDKFELKADETEKTITIAVTAKNNYTGTAFGTYEVKKPATDQINLSKAKIVAKAKNTKGKDAKVGKQEYTGEVIEPEIRVLVKQDKTWTEVDESKYEISYINNVMKGKATILVTGNGTDAIGSKTTTFTITNMRMNLFKLIFK